MESVVDNKLIFENMIINMDPDSIISLCQTNKSIHHICNDHEFWKNILRKQYGYESITDDPRREYLIFRMGTSIRSKYMKLVSNSDLRNKYLNIGIENPKFIHNPGNSMIVIDRFVGNQSPIGQTNFMNNLEQLRGLVNVEDIKRRFLDEIQRRNVARTGFMNSPYMT